MGYIRRADGNVLRIDNRIIAVRSVESTQIALIAGFSNPVGIALDVANNRYYVTNYGSGTVQIMTQKYR